MRKSVNGGTDVLSFILRSVILYKVFDRSILAFYEGSPVEILIPLFNISLRVKIF